MFLPNVGRLEYKEVIQANDRKTLADTRQLGAIGFPATDDGVGFVATARSVLSGSGRVPGPGGGVCSRLLVLHSSDSERSKTP
jgi:hypothetical protein